MHWHFMDEQAQAVALVTSPRRILQPEEMSMSVERQGRSARPVAAITGASSGIGAAFARKLAPVYDLLLIARRRDRLEQLASELSGSQSSHHEVIQADLTVERELASVAERIENEKRLALLVNNAGFGTKGRFWETSLDSQQQMHQLHIMATMQLTHAGLRNMAIRDSGGIINVASAAAFVRSAGSVSYCATKTWMTAFTEGLYLELRSIRSGVTIQALCPGFTYSEFHDTMKVDRQETAPAVFWMSADRVVDASLDGLRQRKLIVIPGLHYRLLTSLLSKVPTRLRLAVEAATVRNV